MLCAGHHFCRESLPICVAMAGRDHCTLSCLDYLAEVRQQISYHWPICAYV